MTLLLRVIFDITTTNISDINNDDIEQIPGESDQLELTSSILTTRAKKLQRKKTTTTQRSMVARPSSLFWFLQSEQ